MSTNTTATLESLLGAEHTATLRAALDRMIPEDDYASACQAGVDAYIARQLSADLSHLLGNYRTGIERLEVESRARFRAEFADLSQDQQDALLSGTEAEGFVAMLAAHAAEGYYADPGNGGNRECASWHMVGFDPRWTIGAGDTTQ